MVVALAGLAERASDAGQPLKTEQSGAIFIWMLHV
jgi:hypothetical protein